MNNWPIAVTGCSRATSSLPPSIGPRPGSERRSHVRVQERSIPDQWPPGPFDLVVLSEIAYYFDVTDLGCVVACVMDSTTRGAHIVGVHWRGETDYPLTGERSHRIIADTAGLVTVVHHIEEKFVLDIWERR